LHKKKQAPNYVSLPAIRLVGVSGSMTKVEVLNIGHNRNGVGVLNARIRNLCEVKGQHLAQNAAAFKVLFGGNPAEVTWDKNSQKEPLVENPETTELLERRLKNLNKTSGSYWVKEGHGVLCAEPAVLVRGQP